MGLRIVCDEAGCEGVATGRIERSEGQSVQEMKYLCADHYDADAIPAGWDESDLHYHPRHYEAPWPTLPLYRDDAGRPRFRENKIVTFLLENGPHDMNSLAVGDFSPEDREHFAQLIGYSLGGFSELSYVSDETYAAAERAAGADLGGDGPRQGERAGG